MPSQIGSVSATCSSSPGGPVRPVAVATPSSASPPRGRDQRAPLSLPSSGEGISATATSVALSSASSPASEGTRRMAAGPSPAVLFPSVEYGARGWSETVSPWHLSTAGPLRLPTGVSPPSSSLSSRCDLLSPPSAPLRRGGVSAVAAFNVLSTAHSLASGGEREALVADPLTGPDSVTGSLWPADGPRGGQGRCHATFCLSST